MGTDFSSEGAYNELQRILSELISKFGKESPQQIPQIYVAMVAGLSALVVKASVDEFATNVKSFSDAADRQSEALVLWTRVPAFATIVVVAVTLVSAIPAFASLFFEHSLS